MHCKLRDFRHELLYNVTSGSGHGKLGCKCCVKTVKWVSEVSSSNKVNYFESITLIQ